MAGVAEAQVPTDTEEAVENWRRRRAVDAERNSLLNKAWELERLPLEEQAIDGQLHNTVQLISDRAGAQCVTRQFAKHSAGDKLEEIYMRLWDWSSMGGVKHHWYAGCSNPYTD